MTPPDEPWTAVNSEGFAAPVALAVDVVVLTVRERALQVLLVRRGGAAALPGGFVGTGESPEATARRKLAEKTGLAELYLEQLATFGRPDRDPRGWIPAVAHLALVPADTEAPEDGAGWCRVSDAEPLAYDHAEILALAVERIRGKLWWSNVAVGMLPGAFTMADARAIYEAIAGQRYDPSTFARDLRATGLVVPAQAPPLQGSRGRPAARFTFAEHAPAWGAGRRKRV